MKLRSFISLLLVSCILIAPGISSAALIDSSLIAEAQNCGVVGNGCSLNTFMKLGLNVAQFILGIVGALTLLMFVYGGIVWILSGGSSDQVKKGKDIIFGSIVGLAIVFSSYLIVQFVTENLLGAEFNSALPKEEVSNQVGGQCAASGGTRGKGSCHKGTSCPDQHYNNNQQDCGTGNVCCIPLNVQTCPPPNAPSYSCYQASQINECTGSESGCYSCLGDCVFSDGAQVGRCCVPVLGFPGQNN